MKIIGKIVNYTGGSGLIMDSEGNSYILLENNLLYSVPQIGDIVSFQVEVFKTIEIDDFERKLKYSQDRDMKAKMTSVGPHRDDFSFLIGDVDIRRFGSQGQQRTAALSLKLSEIELVKKITKDTPILLLDDVLSELDSNRQNYLLNSIGDIQTIITSVDTVLFEDEFLKDVSIFKIENGHLILILSDGSTIDCGALPAAGIDDATTSPDTTWSSNKIVDYVENNVIPPQYDLIHGGQAQEINVSNN